MGHGLEKPFLEYVNCLSRLITGTPKSVTVTIRKDIFSAESVVNVGEIAPYSNKSCSDSPRNLCQPCQFLFQIQLNGLYRLPKSYSQYLKLCNQKMRNTSFPSWVMKTHSSKACLDLPCILF